jgi:hypothetical protein
MQGSYWRLVVLAVLLSAVTGAFLAWDGRYSVVADDVLPNARFDDGFDAWTGTHHDVALSDSTPRQVRIQSNFGGQTPLVTQIIRDLDGISHLRVAADIRTEGIVPAGQFWQRAGVFLYSVSRQNRRIWYWPYEIALIEGTSDWRRHSAVIPVSPDAGYMQLFLFNASADGSMYARNLTVEAVAENGLVRAARWGLMAAWIIFGGVVLVIVLRRRRTVLSLVTCTGAAAILLSLVWPQPDLSIMQRTALRTALIAAHTAVDALRSAPQGMQEDMQAEQSATLSDEAPPADSEAEADEPSGDDGGDDAVAPADEEGATAMAGEEPMAASFDLFHMDSTAAAHLAVFVVFAGFARLAFRRDDAAYLLIALMAFALASEIVQGFTITRTVELEDGVYNAVGVIVGLLVTSAGLAVLARLRRR